MQGLRWEDRQQQDFGIRRSVWSGIKKGTKTRYRKSPVPIIEPLEENPRPVLEGLRSA